MSGGCAPKGGRFFVTQLKDKPNNKHFGKTLEIVM